MRLLLPFFFSWCLPMLSSLPFLSSTFQAFKAESIEVAFQSRVVVHTQPASSLNCKFVSGQSNLQSVSCSQSSCLLLLSSSGCSLFFFFFSSFKILLPCNRFGWKSIREFFFFLLHEFLSPKQREEESCKRRTFLPKKKTHLQGRHKTSKHLSWNLRLFIHLLLFLSRNTRPFSLSLCINRLVLLVLRFFLDSSSSCCSNEEMFDVVDTGEKKLWKHKTSSLKEDENPKKKGTSSPSPPPKRIVIVNDNHNNTFAAVFGETPFLLFRYFFPSVFSPSRRFMMMKGGKKWWRWSSSSSFPFQPLYFTSFTQNDSSSFPLTKLPSYPEAF